MCGEIASCLVMNTFYRLSIRHSLVPTS